jgi:Zn-dependent M28 family amino/carboxypeptidase
LRQVGEIFVKEGVVAELRDASKDFALFNMTSMGGMEYRIDNLPTAFVIHEDYLRIWRLLESKQPVEVEVNIQNETIPGPVEISNTIAEIRGSDKPDEVVIVGAHLDSWDLATGATDNATGSAVVMEAARAIHALGISPKRTIRFMLFVGEEQGSVGSRDYIKAHSGELDKIQGVVIHDTGTGMVKTFSLEQRYDLREAMDRIATPLREIGLEELTMRRTEGSDHVPFRDEGVPAFFALQAPADYRRTHHSQADTFDKVHKDELIQGAKAVVALVWNLSEYPEKLPRKKMEPQAGAGSNRP